MVKRPLTSWSCLRFQTLPMFALHLRDTKLLTTAHTVPWQAAYFFDVLAAETAPFELHFSASKILIKIHGSKVTSLKSSALLFLSFLFQKE